MDLCRSIYNLAYNIINFICYFHMHFFYKCQIVTADFT